MKVKKICEGVIQIELTNKDERNSASKYGTITLNREMTIKIIDVFAGEPGQTKTLIGD